LRNVSKETAFDTHRSKVKYTPEVKALVEELLRKSKFARDKLPYTEEFDRLKSEYTQRLNCVISDADFWKALSSIGKGGGIGKAGGRRTSPSTESLSQTQQLEILRLLPEGVGSRDQLPYTPLFDELHRRFSQLTHTSLSKHSFWRGLSRVAKLNRKPQALFQTAPLGALGRELVEFLERSNPWWRGQPGVPVERFRRWAFDEVLHRLDSKLAPATVVRGPRQVGKTTIQHQLIEYLLLIRRVPPQRIFRVQFDEVPALGSLVQPVDTLVRWYEENVLREPINALARRGEDVYLFFDELQNIPQWSGQLKALVDNVAARTLVTGSSALRIHRQRDSLAGRLSTLELGPLRLSEIIGIRGFAQLKPFAADLLAADLKHLDTWSALGEYGIKHKTVIGKGFQAFSSFGGYPWCQTNSNEGFAPLAKQITDTVVDRTIEYDPLENRGRSINRPLLRETFRLACRYAGQAVTPRRVAQEIGNVLSQDLRDESITEALQFLSDTMLLHQIVPLELLLKKQGHPPKLCLCDHFIRAAWLQEMVPLVPHELSARNEAVSAIAGRIIESSLGYYYAGISDFEVAWFPERHGEPEVDLVLTIGDQRIPIEVKYQRQALTDADVAGIRSFCSKPHYEAPFGIVITQDIFGRIDDRVIAIPAPTMLMLK